MYWKIGKDWELGPAAYISSIPWVKAKLVQAFIPLRNIPCFLYSGWVNPSPSSAANISFPSSENFLGVRFISLWLTINHAIFRKVESDEILGPENKTEMAKAWAKINKKYALKLAKQEIHENSRRLLKNYKSFFTHPFFNLFKMVKIFLFGKKH